MPDLAPFEANERIKPLGGLDYAHRIFVQQLFSKAFFLFCNRKITIKPVYFWPGDRVDLPCLMCDRHDVYNGRMKYWAFTRLNFFKKFYDLSTLPKEQWSLLDEETVRNFRLPNEYLVFMPMHNPKEANAYGLYRCFDDSDREKVEVVHYLIPIVPLFIMEKALVYKFECTMGTRHDDQNIFERFDSMHRFHVVTPTVWDGANPGRNFVPEHWNNEEISQVIFSPPQTGVIYVLPAIVSKKVRIDLNLQIFVHWSPWSACDEKRKYRTRRGYCSIGRVQPSKEFKLTDLQHKILMARDLEMFIILHRLMDTVDEFKRSGIPLFSGVMYHLITDKDDSWPVGQCTNFKYEYFKNRTVPDRVKIFHDYIIEPLKSEAYHIKAMERREGVITKIYETACFYLNETDRPSMVLYGFPLNQNERC